MSSQKRHRPSTDEGKKSTGGDSGIIKLNHLDYDTYPDMTACVSRTHVTSPFRNKTYLPGDKAECIVNVGAAFVNAYGSYLTFKTVSPANILVDSSSGKFDSALNFIKTITLTSRDGTIIEHIRDANIIQNITRVGKFSQDWDLTYGGLMGTHKVTNFPYELLVNTGWVSRWVIPLRFLSNLFDREQLLPPQLMSGMRIELEFEIPQRVTQWQADDALNTYTVSDIRLVTDSLKMSDSVCQAVAKKAATSGIELDYRTHFLSRSTTDVTNTHAVVAKSASRAFGVLGHVSRPAATLAAEAVANSLCTETWDVLEYQWRVGSLYLPQQPIRGNNPQQSGVEGYFHLLQYMKRIGDSYKTGDITRGDFVGAAPGYQTTSFKRTGGMGWLAGYLCRMEGAMNSGLPLNNSRMMELNVKFATAATRDIRLFLEHLKRVRVFVDKVEIEE